MLHDVKKIYGNNFLILGIEINRYAGDPRLCVVVVESTWKDNRKEKITPGGEEGDA